MIRYLSHIIKINKIHIIGVNKGEESDNYEVLTIERKKNKIEIKSRKKYDAIENVSEQIDLKIPILLVVDGKGVLNKEINFNKEEDVLWHRNIDFNTIYHTSLKSTNSSFISFCRKNSIEEVIKQFKHKGFQIIDIYIGSFLAALLQPSIQKNEILSGNLILSFENNQLIRFEKQINKVKDEKYNIGLDTISSNILPLYGALIHFYLQQKEISKTEDQNLNVEEIIYKKAFNLFGATMLVTFLSSLLISYFLIQFYSSKNTDLILKNTFSNQSYQKILEMEKQKENKINILSESGFLSSKFLSFYSYELSKSSPNEIELNELHITPTEKEIKENKKMFFETKTILIKGETFQEAAIYSWLQQLKKFPWIKNFEIISLKKDKKEKSIFELKINLKDV